MILCCFFLPFGLWLHPALKHQFIDSVSSISKPYAVKPQLLVGTLLNAAYFVVIATIPFPALIEAFPFGSFIKAALEAANLHDGAFFLVFDICLAGSAGPVTIYAMRHLRFTGQYTGTKVLTLLQLLCYVSWLLVILYLVGVLPVPSPLSRSWQAFLVFILPSTFAALAILLAVRD